MKHSNATANPERRRRQRPAAGAWLQLGASLLWLPQAALLAWSLACFALPWVNGQGLAPDAVMESIWMAAAGLLLAGLLRAECDAWGARLSHREARAQVTQLRARAIAVLAAQSPVDRARTPSGAAASVVAEQAEAVLPYLVRYPSVALRVAVQPLLYAVAVACVSWVAALVLVVTAPLIPLFMAVIGWRAQQASQAHLQDMGGMNAFLLDRLRGLPTLRALGAVRLTAMRVRSVAEDLRRRAMAVLRIAFLSSAVLELFAALGVALVAVYIGFHLLGQLRLGTWGRAMGLGEALFVLLMAPAFYEPLRDLAAVWHDKAAGQAALSALLAMEHHDAPTLPYAPAGPAACAPPAKAMPRPWSVQAVALAYTPKGAGQECIQGFDMHVRAGEHVALMGPSGTGKSTLLALMAGLVAPDAGTLLLNGQRWGGDKAEALRQGIAWMGQRPHVFCGSVRSNVALDRPELRSTDVDLALDRAALRKVAQERTAMTLGEGGTGLSGGELVRLALARLMAQQSACLVLVDEPTAHLDRETAAEVMDALCAWARGRTLVVATHDPWVAARMDRTVRIGAAGWEMAA